MSDIAWVGTSHEEPYPITKKKWHTETMNIARETEIQLQALISEELEEEDESLEEEINFPTSTIPKGIVMN
jgi:sucrose-6-phosphate hydrolase SacC (GH32 family)